MCYVHSVNLHSDLRKYVRSHFTIEKIEAQRILVTFSKVLMSETQAPLFPTPFSVSSVAQLCPTFCDPMDP